MGGHNRSLKEAITTRWVYAGSFDVFTYMVEEKTKITPNHWWCLYERHGVVRYEYDFGSVKAMPCFGEGCTV